MLESSKGDDIPQTFLITPKLLPDLIPDNELCKNLTILFIFNGVFNLKQKEMEENWYFNEEIKENNTDKKDNDFDKIDE
jgi:hypothetical protein